MASTIHRARATVLGRHQLLAQLLSRQDALLRSRKQLLREGQPSGVMDFEEQSLDAEEQGVGWSLLELESQALQDLETALQRLEAGAFGTCSDCDGAISEARLRAMPFAELCLACQEQRDSDAAAAAKQAGSHWAERLAWARQ